MVFTFLSKLKKLDQAIDDCSKAIKLDDTYIKAYLRRAQWYVFEYIGNTLDVDPEWQ